MSRAPRLDGSFRVRRPVRLSRTAVEALYGPVEPPRPWFGLWLLVALACVMAGAFIAEAPTWLIP